MMTITDLIHQLLPLQYLTEKRHVYLHLRLHLVVHLVVLSKLFVVVPIIICDYFFDNNNISQPNTKKVLDGQHIL
jgi:hypothetical protein